MFLFLLRRKWLKSYLKWKMREYRNLRKDWYKDEDMSNWYDAKMQAVSDIYRDIFE